MPATLAPPLSTARRPRVRMDVRPAALPSRTPPGVPARRRELVSAHVMLGEMNRALAERDECAGMSVQAGRWMAEPSDLVCNWSISSLQVRVSGATHPLAFARLREVVAQARARYDVLLPG